MIDHQAIHELGLHAALRGADCDAHSYRRQDRRAAWLGGWQQGRRMVQEQADRGAITDADRAAHAAHMQRLRCLLADL